MTKTKLNRAVSISQLQATTFDVMDFEGPWFDLMGKPELRGSMIGWGESGNGKTRGMLKFAKYLTNFGKVAYNSIEEGVSFSIQQAFQEVGMDEVAKKLILLDREPMEELILRLRKRRSPDIIFIDSLQYAQIDKRGYIQLMREFGEKKLFVWVSHADGKQPAGRLGKTIRYDAFVKMQIEGYRINALSRYGGGIPYTIWEEGAAAYYNNDL